MAGEFDLAWRGLDEYKAQLKALPAKLRIRVLRNALAAGARIVRDAARSRAPVLRKPDPRRKAGTVRKAIVVRTSKQAKAEGNVGVFVNVKPLSKSQVRSFKSESGKAGASNPDDPFYWRWQNYGRKGRAASAATDGRKVARKQGDRSRIGGLLRFVRGRRARRAVGSLPAIRFLEAGAAKLGEALRRIGQVLGPGVQRIVDRQANQ